MGYKYTDDVLEQYKKINGIVWSKLEKGEIKTVADLYEERCKILFEIYNINEKMDKFNDFCWYNVNYKENITTINPNYEINRLEELLSMLV